MRRPHRLAVTNQKGGVGKTTTAVNLAAALAQSGRDVMVIDLDPQGNASTGLGASQASRAFSTYTLLTRALAKGSPLQPFARLRLVPASSDLAGADIELVDRPRREHSLATALEAWIAGQPTPDIIIFDCPPSLGLLTLNALVAADTVVVPLQCEFFALEGLAQLTDTFERVRLKLNPTLTLLGIVLTMYDRRNSLSELVATDVRSFFGAKVFETVIPRNVRVSEAPSHGKPVVIYDPKSAGALAYVRLADELQDRLT